MMRYRLEIMKTVNAAAGRLGETLVGKLREGLHNTVTDLRVALFLLLCACSTPAFFVGLASGLTVRAFRAGLAAADKLIDQLAR